MAIYIDDRELVAAHQAGDTDAFDELVREYRPALFAHGRRKLYCDEAAEDAVQETFVRAYRALPRFNGQYQLGPWLHRIMANVCIDEANRRSRDGQKAGHYAAQPSVRQNALSAEDELGLDTDDTKLRAALNELPETHREALVLRFVDDLEYEQVAAVSGVSEQNARARVSRARSAIRAALKGVAVLPAVLAGFLKRGEKAAAAATSSGGAIAASTSSTISGATATVSGSAAALPTITEAAVAATNVAPTAIPVLTKAVVGVGLAAAVLTPTSDSAVHRAIEDISTNQTLAVSAISIEEGADSLDPANQQETGKGALVVVASELVNDGSQVNSSNEMNAEVLPKFERGSISETDPASGVANNGSTDLLKATSVKLEVGGAGRYFLSGPIELSYDGRRLQGVLGPASMLSFGTDEDEFGEIRLDGLLIVEQSSGEIVETRLAGFAVQNGGTHKIGGLFSISGSEDRPLQRGTFKGTVQMLSDDSPASLELILDR